MSELPPEEIMARIRGELENFAKDTVEYFQKTGLVDSPNVNTYAKRLTQLAKAHRLERERLREEVAETYGLWFNAEGCDLEQSPEICGRELSCSLCFADEIIALLPTEEEIRKGERDRIADALLYTVNLKDWLLALK